MIDRDSVELRRIIRRAIRYSSTINWLEIRRNSGTQGIENKESAIIEKAIEDDDDSKLLHPFSTSYWGI